MVAEAPDFCGEFVIFAGDHAGVSEGAEIFCGIERVPTCFSDGACGSEGVGGAESLCGVFENGNAMVCADVADGGHVGAAPEEVDGADRFGLGVTSESGLELGWVDVERVGLDIDEDGARAEPGDATCGGEEGVRGGDDDVPRLDVQRHEEDELRVGPRGDADAVACTGGNADGFFEILRLFPEHELLRVTDFGDFGEDLFAERPVLERQVEERHVHRTTVPDSVCGLKGNVLRVRLGGAFFAGQRGAMSAGPEVGVPVWMALPFVLMLVGIAAGSGMFPHWWERMYPRVSVGLATLSVLLYLPGRSIAPFGHAMEEYLGFIALVGSLFVASGGILIRVRGESSPVANVAFLVVGAVLANVIGTTGASMVLIRPWIRTNRYRMTGFHVVFFILVISNVGGCLTPIGDPPLFLGYLKGVPFWWVARGCFSGWILMVTLLLAVFYAMDVRNLRSVPKSVLSQHGEPETWQFSGAWAALSIGLILGAVFLPAGFREAVMCLGAGLAWWRTPRELYEGNHFSWGPLREVAWLFAGIFMTMVPALEILRQSVGGGGDAPTALGLFWSAGMLSGVLDNAPTYMAFLVSAMAAVGLEVQGGMAQFIERHPDLLRGISMGAVFFGAATYIGNGPNLMVRAICEQQGISTPSFGAYVLKYTVPILLPVLGLVGWMVLR